MALPFAPGIDGADIVGFIMVESEDLANGFRGHSAAELAAFFAGDPILAAATSAPQFQQILGEIVIALNPDDDEDLSPGQAAAAGMN